MSERDFSKIPPSIWRDPRFLALDGNGRSLAIYFRSSPHHNACGCYRVPDAYAADDNRWPIALYLQTREAVLASGLILFDAVTSEVYVTDWYQANAPKGPKQEVGCIRHIERIASAQLAEKVAADFEATKSSVPSAPAERDPIAEARQRKVLRSVT